MKFLCECQDENCKIAIDMTLDDFLHISDSRCFIISEDCLVGPLEEDNLFEKKDGYSLYKGTL